MAILLWHTWGSIFEVHPQPFLFADYFEGNMFTSIVKAQVLFLHIILIFQILIKPNITPNKLDLSFMKELHA